jgi:hypothetical protein
MTMSLHPIDPSDELLVDDFDSEDDYYAYLEDLENVLAELDDPYAAYDYDRYAEEDDWL